MVREWRILLLSKKSSKRYFDYSKKTYRMDIRDVALPLLVGSLSTTFLRVEREPPGRWEALGRFFAF